MASKLVEEQSRLMNTKSLNFEFRYDSYYLYVSWENCREIFLKRCIDLEPLFWENNLINGIVLLTLPPESEDSTLLNQLYGSNCPLDSNRIECFIKIKREVLDKNEKYLIKLDKFKFAFTKRILFGLKFPKHEFRSNFKSNCKSNIKKLI